MKKLFNLFQLKKESKPEITHPRQVRQKHPFERNELLINLIVHNEIISFSTKLPHSVGSFIRKVNNAYCRHMALHDVDVAVKGDRPFKMHYTEHFNILTYSVGNMYDQLATKSLIHAIAVTLPKFTFDTMNDTLTQLVLRLPNNPSIREPKYPDESIRRTKLNFTHEGKLLASESFLSSMAGNLHPLNLRLLAKLCSDHESEESQDVVHHLDEITLDAKYYQFISDYWESCRGTKVNDYPIYQGRPAFMEGDPSQSNYWVKQFHRGIFNYVVGSSSPLNKLGVTNEKLA